MSFRLLQHCRIPQDVATHLQVHTRKRLPQNKPSLQNHTPMTTSHDTSVRDRHTRTHPPGKIGEEIIASSVDRGNGGPELHVLSTWQTLGLVASASLQRSVYQPNWDAGPGNLFLKEPPALSTSRPHGRTEAPPSHRQFSPDGEPDTTTSRGCRKFGVAHFLNFLLSEAYKFLITRGQHFLLEN